MALQIEALSNSTTRMETRRSQSNRQGDVSVDDQRNERRVWNIIVVGWIIPFCWHKRGVNYPNAESCTHLEIDELRN